MSAQITVIKRNGDREPLNLNKFHKVVAWGCEGLEGVSVSEIEMKTHLNLFDGIATRDIQNTIIKAAADLISADHPNYQYVAARYQLLQLRKEAYGSHNPPGFIEHYTRLVKEGLYDDALLKNYSEHDLLLMDKAVDHDRDWNFAYAAVQQLQGKYLVQNRVTKQVYESPQMMYMLISAFLLMNEPAEHRMKRVIRFYNAISQFKISLPTPIMAGVRTRTRQFSSCVVIEAGDSLDEINAASNAIVKYVSQRAGIGLAINAIRGIGSEIRGGEASHTGKIPFIKKFEHDVKCCSQGGVRGGAATVFFPIWDYEYEDLIVLKNNRGIETNRARRLDYGVLISGFFYQRLLQKGNISLFSTSDVPGLLEAFYADQDEFARLYEIYESDPNIRKKTVPAVDIFGALASERASTGRIYPAHIDHLNTHGSFIPERAPIKQSNLCLEIALPTAPMEDSMDGESGEVSLCTLSAFNLGAIDSLDELEELADLGVRALDNLLDYQDYPIPAAEISSKCRRSLGFGIINYAYYLAKNGLKYSDGSAVPLTHQMMEAVQYYLLKASMNLAKERGACSWFDDTKYSQGILPIDTYKKALDDECKVPYLRDWDTLRQEIQKHGLRNSTLTALMPSETSSQISNATNGIEPPRGLVSIKGSKDGTFKQVVPDVLNLKDQYELLWDMPNNNGYLLLSAVMQKFVDQAISANTNYDPARFPGGKVPTSQVIKDMLRAYKLGVKTLYYHNTRDNVTDSTAALVVEKEDEDCAGGGCKI